MLLQLRDEALFNINLLSHLGQLLLVGLSELIDLQLSPLHAELLMLLHRLLFVHSQRLIRVLDEVFEVGVNLVVEGDFVEKPFQLRGNLIDWPASSLGFRPPVHVLLHVYALVAIIVHLVKQSRQISTIFRILLEKLRDLFFLDRVALIQVKTLEDFLYLLFELDSQ